MSTQRWNEDASCGVVSFTLAADFILHIADPTEPIQQTAEREQVDRAEGGAAVGNAPELVLWHDVGQIRCNRAQRAIRARIDDPVLAPMLTAADDIKLVTALRMKGVRNAHFEAGRVHTACS